MEAARLRKKKIGFVMEALPGGVSRITVTNQNSTIFHGSGFLLQLFGLIVVVLVALSGTVAPSIAVGICIPFLLILPLVRKSPPTTLSESISIFPGLGVQLESIHGQRRFFSVSDIEFFTINEGFERCRIVVYLVLVTVSKECVVLFNDTRPDLKALVAAFDALDTWLSVAKSGPK